MPLVFSPVPDSAQGLGLGPGLASPNLIILNWISWCQEPWESGPTLKTNRQQRSK